MSRPLSEMRLLITSHVIHYQFDGRLFAYGPYAREIDLWADLFREVVIASPCRLEKPPGDCLPFGRENIRIDPQREAGGDSLVGKLSLAAAIPAMVCGLARSMSKADAIHVRCPGNLGLIGVLLAPLMGRPLVAKYAAQWDSAVNEPWSAKLQKFILRSRWWKGPVTVYGKWPNQPSHVIPFFTSLLTSQQMDQARIGAAGRRLGGPLRVLYTGRLSKAKHVDTVIKAAARALHAGIEIECTVIGVGPERQALEALAAELQIADRVRFTGGIPFQEVVRELASADVLALLSETEGWPKSIAEGMAFGLVCIGSNRGFVPEMLSEGRGIAAPTGDEAALAEILIDVARAPERYAPMRAAAASWAQRFSLEGLREAIRELLLKYWAAEPVSGIPPREPIISNER
jgi:glycosyltransferase involved in cell wall biosynthesis